MCQLGISPAVKIIADYKPLGYLAKGGGGVQPKFLGKTRFEDRVYQKASPIGGEVSESLRLLRSARQPCP